MVCGGGSVAQSNIFNVKEFSVEPFHLFPDLIGQGTGVVSPSPFFTAAPGLGQNENRVNQNALQRDLTVSSDQLGSLYKYDMELEA